MPPSLTDAETHYAFGRNWEAFAAKGEARSIEPRKHLQEMTLGSPDRQLR